MLVFVQKGFKPYWTFTVLLIRQHLEECMVFANFRSGWCAFYRYVYVYVYIFIYTYTTK